MNNRIIAVINQKGGVGKTTTTANLAFALSKLDKKVTIIDLDPQCHLAVSLGMIDNMTTGIDEVFLGRTTIDKCSMKIRDNLNLIVSGHRLREIEQLDEGGANRGDLLKRALHEQLTDQDFIFIDCPPSSGILAANALFAANELLIPMSSDFLSLQGLAHLMVTIKRFEKALKKRYKMLIVMSRFAKTRRISKQVLDTLIKHFPNKILATVIRESAILAECPSFGKSVIEYRPSCNSADDFTCLAHDFLTEKVL